MIPGFSAAPMMIRGSSESLVTLGSYEDSGYLGLSYSTDPRLGSLSKEPLSGHQLIEVYITYSSVWNEAYAGAVFSGNTEYVTEMRLGDNYFVKGSANHAGGITDMSFIITLEVAQTYQPDTPYRLEFS